MDIKIERSQNDKLTKLTLGDITIYFSYETPVAFSIENVGIAGTVVSDKGWSVSTRRHLGTITNRRDPIPHAQFTRALEAIAASAAGSVSDSAISTLQSALKARCLDCGIPATHLVLHAYGLNLHKTVCGPDGAYYRGLGEQVVEIQS